MGSERMGENAGDYHVGHLEEPFTRYPGNPILTAKDIPYPANSVFNAGATKIGDNTLLLMRVEDRRGLSHLTVARSKDGFTSWLIDPRPTLPADPEGHPEEFWGIEDPRICCLEGEGRYIITHTAYSQGGPLVSLATTITVATAKASELLLWLHQHSQVSP